MARTTEPEPVIGIGVDLVEVDRMRRALARTPSLAGRLFTTGERAYATAARDPAERYAARFAAKEAVMKALGVGLGAFDWHDVEVVRADSGRPSLHVSGRAAELAADLGVRSWLLTLTHTTTQAEAIAVAL
ncbi:MAG: acpS [Acidimicrobiales bacterium]|nr:acpS [Acidimicrobiales bacterium]